MRHGWKTDKDYKIRLDRKIKRLKSRLNEPKLSDASRKWITDKISKIEKLYPISFRKTEQKSTDSTDPSKERIEKLKAELNSLEKQVK